MGDASGFLILAPRGIVVFRTRPLTRGEFPDISGCALRPEGKFKENGQNLEASALMGGVQKAPKPKQTWAEWMTARAKAWRVRADKIESMFSSKKDKPPTLKN